MREVTTRLLFSIEFVKQMDESITTQVEKAELSGVEEEKIAFVKDEILFPLRQRMDMQQVIVVNQQDIVSIRYCIFKCY